jgi:hypothetical protein
MVCRAILARDLPSAPSSWPLRGFGGGGANRRRGWVGGISHGLSGLVRQGLAASLAREGNDQQPDVESDRGDGDRGAKRAHGGHGTGGGKIDPAPMKRPTDVQKANAVARASVPNSSGSHRLKIAKLPPCRRW